ncbi:MAG: hypothetical protein ACOYON_09870 [Fimbriimonas sp.]
MKNFLIIALVATTTAVFAQSATWTGALMAGDPTYHRAVEDGSFLSVDGTNVRYNVQPFFVTANGLYTFEVQAQTLARTPMRSSTATPFTLKTH